MIVLQAINPEHPELADDPDLAAEIAELEIPFVITQDVKDFLKFALALNKKTQEFIDKATQVMKNQTKPFSNCDRVCFPGLIA